MAYTPVADANTDVGKPVRSTDLKQLVTNQDDFNTRLNSVESFTSKVILFGEPIRNAASFQTLSALEDIPIINPLNIVEAKLWIYLTGSLTGTLEVDVLRSSSPDFTGATSIFTTRPSINFATASDYDESTNAVIDVAQQSLSDGDYLRLSITSMPSNGVLGTFGFKLSAEAQ
jgi:hypothetical protein